MGIIHGLLSAFSQGLGYVSLKKSYEEFAPSVAFLFDAVFGLLIWVPFSLIIGIDFSKLSTVLVYALISAMLSEAFVFYALSKKEISITGTLFSTYPVYTILFSILINHESLSFLQWVFIGLTIAGTLVVTLPKSINRKEWIGNGVLIWPLVAAMAVGFSDSLSKNIINQTSATTFLFALSIAQVPISLGYLYIEKQSLGQFKNIFRKLKSYRFAVLGSFLNVICVLFLWLAFQSTYASVASPLTAAYPGIIILLAYLFLKERVELKALVGLLIIIIGIIGLASIGI